MSVFCLKEMFVFSSLSSGLSSSACDVESLIALTSSCVTSVFDSLARLDPGTLLGAETSDPEDSEDAAVFSAAATSLGATGLCFLAGFQ